ALAKASVSVPILQHRSTLAFARAGRNVKGIDIDPVRIAIARHNAQKLDYPLEFIIADVTKAQLPDADTVFFDPARRDEYGKRIYDVDKYIPPLSLVRDLRRSYDLVISKLSPGIETQQLEQYAGIVSFLSVNGDLKEAELTLSNSGSFTTAELFLPERIEPIVYYHAETVEATLTDTPAGWLNEPDPAIIRAGYVQHITNDCDGNMLDPTIAYFTTAGKPDSVWVRSWRILDWMPFNLKKLKAYLKQRNVGTVTVKKRGSPITPEELQAKLKLKGNNSLTVVLTRLHGNPIVIICEDYVP
ncbi:MAG: class I SAM-dependent methyltransferase, partial [Chloroflexota bacterium]